MPSFIITSNQITNKISEYFSAVVITDLNVNLIFSDAIIEPKKTLEQTTVHTRNFIFEKTSNNKNNPSGIGKIIIMMTFAIPTLKITNQKIETTIFMGG